MLSALIALTTIEVALWIWRPFPLDPPLYPGDREVSTVPSPHSVIDSDIGWRYAPLEVIDDPSPDFHVTYRCNADGFRAVQPREERAGALPIAFVGDSFTFGVGIEEPDTFVELVAAARDDLRVANFGMPGFGVDQMERTLVHRVLREPPMVVVALFVLDDMTRCLSAYRDRAGWTAKPSFTVERGALVPLNEHNGPSEFQRWFAGTFYVAEAWRRAENKYGLEYGFGRRFELARALFLAMSGECKARDVQFLAVHLPERGAWRPMPSLANSLRAFGVHFLDLGEMRVDDPSKLYFAHDPHLTPEGHRFVADAVLAALAEPGGVLHAVVR
jgi:hypothetical protein